MFKQMDKIKNDFFRQSDEFIKKVKLTQTPHANFPKKIKVKSIQTYPDNSQVKITIYRPAYLNKFVVKMCRYNPHK